jgi:hypothetical protein
MDGEAHSRPCDRVVQWGAENIDPSRVTRSDAAHHNGHAVTSLWTRLSVFRSPCGFGQSYYCYDMRPSEQKIARIDPKLSWDDTARAMANESEDWSAWDQTLSDGLDRTPWEPRPARRVADGG